MSRMENREVMGFFAIHPKHHATVTSLVAPATPAHRLLDPFGGEGEFLEAAAKGWNVTLYANKLDGERVQKCIERFGSKQVVRCDVGWLRLKGKYPMYTTQKHVAGAVTKGLEVMLIVALSHLTEKWQRELLSIQPDSLVQRSSASPLLVAHLQEIQHDTGLSSVFRRCPSVLGVWSFG
jgi:hypothetical protein